MSEPWSFDRHLVILQRLENTTSVDALKLDSVLIWVQVHHIPVSYLNRGVAEDLCEAIGMVDRSANDTEVDRGNFFRIQVRVDISIPLCRVECCQWRMAKNVGCHSNMNIFPIISIGVDVWITLIGTVRNGLKAMEP